MSTQSDQKLKDYIFKRVPTNNKIYVDELSHEALVGYAQEIQALFNKRVAAKTQTTTDLLDVSELNCKMVVNLNHYFSSGVTRTPIGSGDVDIIKGTIIIKSVKDNNKNNNNNITDNSNDDMSGLFDLDDDDQKAKGGTLDATALALIKAFSQVIKSPPEDATKDKDGRKRKRRKLGKRNDKSVRYSSVCFFFLPLFPFLSF